MNLLSTKEVFGWTLPAADTHFEEYLTRSPELFGRRVYQPKHLQETLRAATNHRTAIDIGAHVGFWSYYLARYFDRVHAFEPVQEFARCFRRNVIDEHVTLHETALGDNVGLVAMNTPIDNSGMSHVSPDEVGSIPVERLDSFEFFEVDLIKIDVEGYELRVVQGARQTLLRNRPTIIVEQKSGSERYGAGRYAAVEYLKTLGAVVIRQVVDDYIFGWPGDRAGA